MPIEKRAGYDWVVSFRDIDDNSIIEATIFGVMSAAQVAQQAHADASLSDDYEIVAIVRYDVVDEIFKKAE